MRYVQAAMSPRLYLSSLASLLRQPGIPPQTEIAQALGVDQPFVSRAKADQLIRITERVRALRKYASERRRAYRRDAHRPAPDQPEAVQEEVRDAAIAACQDYLEAGFDPRVLRDQVALLRRAQAGAVRASARPTL